jgi:hypothetical protein
MMTYDEMIAVIQHHKNGGKVEFQTRFLGKNSSWEEISEPSWDFYASNYRAKPEPITIFAEISCITGQVLRASTKSMLHEFDNTTIKKFIEV